MNTANRSVTARAPTRLDFGGGWTDVPPYCEEQGGYVCNIAITRYAVATVAAGSGHESGPVAGSDTALAAAALRRARSNDAGQPLSLALHSDFPISAGLGGSSAAGVASLGALLGWRGESIERASLAELSRKLEVEDLGVAGGRQDHYAAAFGGALGLTFGDKPVQVERLAVSDEFAAALERRGVLVYTGESRISGDTITAVLDAYNTRDPRVCTALAAMKKLATQMRDAIENDSLDDLARLVGEHWMHQRALHPGITTPAIERLMDAGRRAGAMGGKAMGASGGGSVLLIAREGEQQRLRAAAAAVGEVLDFSVDRAGLVVSGDDPNSGGDVAATQAALLDGET